MKAVIADGGSVAGHFASIAREMGIPMIVNSARATSLLEHGADVTVDATRCMVYAGIWEGLEKWQSKNLHTLPDSPFRRKLKCLLTNITSLHLTDPASPQFTPEHCRSFHDIVRYAHEKTVEEIFSLSSRGAGLVRGSRKLESTLPISLYVLELEGGMSGQKEERGSVRIEDIDCQSLKSLWAGLTHKDVQWSSHLRHADWQELDRISSGIFSRDSRLLSSFALIARDYLNVNIRFGYHFVVLDSFCGDEPRENYIGLQFEGGGGNFEGRRLRIRLMERILLQKGFEVQCKGDVLHAELRQAPCQVLCGHMEMLGRLLGTTRLLDIRLKDEEDIDTLTESFFQDQ